VPEIDPEQLDHLSYNPAVSGLNLNFNRVHFEWARVAGDWRVTMDARTDLHRPDVTMARMRIADRELPVYTYADGGGVDDWTVARSALGDGGSRWLPVRFPPAYAGDVFRSMARANGIVLGAPVAVEALPAASELARHESPTLDMVLRDMLRFSTNLTAEVVGLAASGVRGAVPPGLGASAALMRDWVGAGFGADALFADHSGLADTSRISARDMVRILSGARAGTGLPGLMRDIAMVDTQGDPVAAPPVSVVAKTGTLNFVSTLAGYARAASGRELVFAIFAADEDARTRAKASVEEVPAGVRDYNAKAKGLQQRLLQRWGTVFAT
jgi:D-alanyl-D-alanine carboxypeptidase/D-alanyl-D-alanine-endopeptidase (penicillin-binding protein 4)